jgi:hypothetical protein
VTTTLLVLEPVDFQDHPDSLSGENVDVELDTSGASFVEDVDGVGGSVIPPEVEELDAGHDGVGKTVGAAQERLSLVGVKNSCQDECVVVGSVEGAHRVAVIPLIDFRRLGEHVAVDARILLSGGSGDGCRVITSHQKPQCQEKQNSKHRSRFLSRTDTQTKDFADNRVINRT